MRKKIGVYICHCGTNIADTVDVKKVREVIAGEEGVVLARDVMFACADSSQKEIIDDIRREGLDGLVIASCSPKLHLFTFRSVAERAGLNPYNYVQVNIREQGSWAHSDNKEGATEKAIRMVRAGVARVARSEALERINISAVNTVAVIGAGVAGMRTALEMAKMGTQVYLIEREHFVGGRTAQWGDLFTTEETGKQIVTRLYEEVMKKENITLFTGAEVVEKEGNIGDFHLRVRIRPRLVKERCDAGELMKAIEVCPVEVEDEFNFGLTKRKAIYRNYESEYPRAAAIDDKACTRCGECVKVCSSIDLDQQEEFITLHAGGIILTTGFDPYEPQPGEFGYGEVDGVVTLQQFHRLLEMNENKLVYHGKKIRSIAYIYCVGSRECAANEKCSGTHKYCSRYCCTSAIHSALTARKKFGDLTIYHINRGIRTYGKQEVLYEQSSKAGDIYIQFYEDSFPAVEKNGKGPLIKVKDFLTAGRELEITPDLLVLVTGMEPRREHTIGELMKVPRGRDGFYNEIHMKLKPVETVIDGVLIAGACQGPKNISESVKSALSAASKANYTLRQGELSLEPVLAVIDAEKCVWCDECTAVCPFDAIRAEDHNGKKVASVLQANCKGCGMCLPVCPENAIQLVGYTDEEMESMIDALQEEV